MHNAVALLLKSRLHNHIQLSACAQAQMQHAWCTGGVTDRTLLAGLDRHPPPLKLCHLLLRGQMASNSM